MNEREAPPPPPGSGPNLERDTVSAETAFEQEALAYVRQGKLRGFARCEAGPGRCRRRPIRAHVISRRQLAHVTDRGFGIRIEGQPSKRRTGESWESYRHRILQFTPAGTDNLLVFRGVCAHHDNELFKSLDGGFQPGNHEHAVTQAYRTALYQDCIHWREAERLNRLREHRGQKRIEDGGPGATFTELELRVIILAGCARIHRAQLARWMNESLHENVAYRQVYIDHPGPAAAGAGVFRAWARGFPSMDLLNLTVIPIERTKTIVNAVMPRRNEALLETMIETWMQGSNTEQKERLSSVMLQSFPDLAIAPQRWSTRDRTWKEKLWKARVGALTGELVGYSDTVINFFD